MSFIADESPVAAGASTLLPVDPGLVCLVMLARFQQVAVEPAQCAHEFGQAGTAFGSQELLLAAKKLQQKTRPLSTTPDHLTRTPLPAIAAALDGGCFRIAKTEGQVLIQDSRAQARRILSQNELMPRWSGPLIPVASRVAVRCTMAMFVATWFIPSLVKFRHLLRDVQGMSCFIRLLALISPLSFQVAIDKGRGHRRYSILDIFCFGLLAVHSFKVLRDGLSTCLRATEIWTVRC